MKTPLRILHLEDDPDAVVLAERTLTKAGVICHVTHVDGRQAFLAALQANTFDVILGDYELPGFDGMSALKLAIGICPDVPFIFVTAGMNDDLVIEAMKNGAADYVVKCRLSRIVPAVQRAVQESQARQDRRRAEAEFCACEARYARLVENLPDAVYVLSARDNTILSVNSAFERITGWSRSEWIGKCYISLIHPDDVHLDRENWQRVLRGEEPSSFEMRVLTKSGGYVMGKFRAVPYLVDGKIVGEIGILRVSAAC